MTDITTFTKVKIKDADAWLTLLESGTLAQGTGLLWRPDTSTGKPDYCCLGVYALTQGAMFEFDGKGITRQCLVDGQDVNSNEVLEPSWALKHGITPSVLRFLADLNDGGTSNKRLDDPAYALYAKHAEETLPMGPNLVRFTVREHSFEEIATIIREEIAEL